MFKLLDKNYIIYLSIFYIVFIYVCKYYIYASFQVKGFFNPAFQILNKNNFSLGNLESTNQKSVFHCETEVQT